MRRERSDANRVDNDKNRTCSGFLVKTFRTLIDHKGHHKMKNELRRILSESARLDVAPDSLADNADLYAAGLSSLATLHVMLAIEETFDIEIPDRLLTRRLFS